MLQQPHQHHPCSCRAYGPGHMLFLQSDLTNDEPRISSDNISMTRWLQQIQETQSISYGPGPSGPILTVTNILDLKSFD